MFPALVFSLFFGFIISSSLVLQKKYPVKASYWQWVLLGTVIGGGVVMLSPNESALNPGLVYVFISGFLAASAMLLPGISGSYVLLLLGIYEYVLSSINSLSYGTIIILVSGIITGALLMSGLISYLLAKYNKKTMVTLITIIFVSSIKVLLRAVAAGQPLQLITGITGGMAAGLIIGFLGDRT